MSINDDSEHDMNNIGQKLRLSFTHDIVRKLAFVMTFTGFINDINLLFLYNKSCSFSFLRALSRRNGVKVLHYTT